MIKLFSRSALFTTFCALALVALSGSSCSARSGGSGSSPMKFALTEASDEFAGELDGLMAASPESRGMDAKVSGGSPAGSADQARSKEGQQRDGRKLIKTGDLRLESRDLAKAEASIGALTRELGGYVASSSNSGTYLSMSLRVPQEKFDLALSSLKASARLLSKSESVHDVTLQYVDMESRIATKKILKERYTDYLRRATKVEDLLAVERSLNDVLSELESMESSFKALRDQIDYATISVGVELPPEAQPASERSIVRGILKVWDGFLGFLNFLVYAILFIILFGLPSVLLLGLLYWLCFGKIGLVRKFFSLLSGKRKQ